jgi:AcrR family transcriptional regulator
MSKRPPIGARKKPVQARSQATVDAILRATIRVLTKEGFDRTSTNKVAEAAGVSVGSLYQYFPSKEALLIALLERHHEQMMAVFFTRLAEVAHGNVRDAIRIVVEALVEGHMRDRVLHRIVVEELPRAGRWREMLKDAESQSIPTVLFYLRGRKDELRDIDLETAAFVVNTTVLALTDRIVFIDDEGERERVVSAACDMITQYLVRS